MSRSGEGFLGWDVDSVPRREVSYGLWGESPLGWYIINHYAQMYRGCAERRRLKMHETVAGRRDSQNTAKRDFKLNHLDL
jgi:hypothetical protein